MPPLLTSIGTFKQNLSGSAFEALAAATGDSLSIPDFREGSRGFVEQVISANDAHKMEVAIYSPLFGDNQYGLRLQHQFNPTVSAAGGVSQLLLPDELDIPVYSTDTLNVQVSGTAPTISSTRTRSGLLRISRSSTATTRARRCSTESRPRTSGPRRSRSSWPSWQASSQARQRHDAAASRSRARPPVRRRGGVF